MGDRCCVTQIGWCSVHGVWGDHFDGQWMCPLRGKPTEFEAGRLAGLREAAEVCRKMAVAEYEQSHEEGSASVIAHEIAGEALSQAQADIRKLIEGADDD